MKRTLLALSLLAICLLACPASTKAQTTPIQFNDHIAFISDSLFSKGQQWGTQFNIAYRDKNFASLTPMREAMDRYITARISEVTNMKDVKGSKNLRMAMLDFLSFEQTMINNAFRPMERLSATASDADVKAALDKMTALSADEASVLKRVSDAQEAYAKANGFTIETAKVDSTGKQ